MISVVLLMAGRGTRMGANENKILLPLGNKEIYRHSLDKFLERGYEVICVINRDDEDKIVNKLPKNVKYVYGGALRGDSVFEGIKKASGDYILIHDSARPFIKDDVLDEIEKIKSDDKCILTYLPVKNTIKVKGDNLKTLERDNLISATTPQCGPKKLLLEAYTKAINENTYFTDDISLIEYYYPKTKIDLVLANEEIFKITTPLDLKIAEIVWSEMND